MESRTLTSLEHVVALGGGHGLGRVMSCLNVLGSRLTGVVTTTDNGGSTGRIRRAEGGIAWGDMRNCLNQMITEPSIASTMFEYRFSGNGELSGHNLGNLILKALDNMSVRPLDAINLIRNMLKVRAKLIPMSETPVDLMAIDNEGNDVYGEVNIDKLLFPPQELQLLPSVNATKEALDAISRADLIIIGPGSFFTSLMPLMLLPDFTKAINFNQAPMIYIENLGKELSPAAAALSLSEKIAVIERRIGRPRIDAVLCAPHINTDDVRDRLIVKEVLEARDVPYRHDRQLLSDALNKTISLLP